ncbi:GLE1-like protein-domain-containing protein [Armillaria luteobubalina]|uniref:mRNA export factor GLE1 n=1 Tax=Armillaria luteobubalina TaxID=153913 RepID=A0AA39USP2_9AGAR|nr:GLE1-like protein-domain-containing protein [Armillaria luteobubalina]
MRFGAPRSPSPSSVRDRKRTTSTFGLHHYDDSDEILSISSSEEDSDPSAPSDNELSPQWRHRNHRPPMLLQKQRQMEEALASIRLRARHNDPYEDWERNVRRESFRTARKNHATSQSLLHDAQDNIKRQQMELLQAKHAEEQRAVNAKLSEWRSRHQQAEAAMRQRWKERQDTLWRRIDAAIALDAGKVRKQMEEEQRIRDEEQRKVREAELKRRLEEEKKRTEEEKKRQEDEAEKKKKEEEEKKEREETERVEAEKKATQEKLEAQKGMREQLGMSTADHDWREARKTLQALKTEVLSVAKNKQGNSAEMKLTWGTFRRQITPKMGQLTHDEATINRISTQLVQILLPPQRHHPVIYAALLSTLAKAIILQAETEVTAEKKSAYPLSKVAFNLLESSGQRIVARTGGWAVPILIGDRDWDGKLWGNVVEKKKAMGYRQQTADNGDMVWETEEVYISRLNGVMRVYFGVLAIQPQKGPLNGSMWRTPMFWAWMARLLGSDGGGRAMLERAVAAELLATGLSVLGSDAKDMWGQQFVKVLALIHEGITIGMGDGKKIGVLLEVERIMGS